MYVPQRVRTYVRRLQEEDLLYAPVALKILASQNFRKETLMTPGTKWATDLMASAHSHIATDKMVYAAICANTGMTAVTARIFDGYGYDDYVTQIRGLWEGYGQKLPDMDSLPNCRHIVGSYVKAMAKLVTARARARRADVQSMLDRAKAEYDRKLFTCTYAENLAILSALGNEEPVTESAISMATEKYAEYIELFIRGGNGIDQKEQDAYTHGQL